MNTHQGFNYVSVSTSRASQEPYKVLLSSFPFYRWGYWSIGSLSYLPQSDLFSAVIRIWTQADLAPGPLLLNTTLLREALQIGLQKDWEDFTEVALRLSLNGWLKWEIDAEGEDTISVGDSEWHAWSEKNKKACCKFNLQWTGHWPSVAPAGPAKREDSTICAPTWTLQTLEI